MRRSKKSWMVLLSVLAVAVGAAAMASESHRHRPFGHGPVGEEMAERHFDRLAEYLELSASQREELAALHERHVEAIEGRFEELRGQFEAVHEMAGVETPDATAIGERVIALHREHEALEAEREGFHREVESLLTPEQAERFAAWRAARGHDEDGPGHGDRHGH